MNFNKIISLLFFLIPVSLYIGSCDPSLYQFSESEPYFAKGKIKAETVELFVVNSLTAGEQVMLATLQGLLADRSARQIFLDPQAGSNRNLLSRIEISDSVSVHTGSDPWTVLAEEANELSGYLLYRNGERSLNAATSLCRPLYAVAVEENERARAEAAGLSLLKDLRGLSEEDVFKEYKDSFNRKLCVELSCEINGCLRDYAVMSGAFCFYAGNSAFRSRVMRFLSPDSVVMGWGDAENGEDRFVGPASRGGNFTLAANYSYNLSLLSAFGQESFSPANRIEFQSLQTDPQAVHTVCFVLSDGDNIQYTQNGYLTDEKWYGYSGRGNFAMGWGIAPAAADLAPPLLEEFYQSATKKDGFVLYTGTGYMYPSYYPLFDLNMNLINLNQYLDRTSTSVVQVIDFLSLRNSLLWNRYMQMENLDAVFYLEYSDHAAHKGEILWYSGKPLITPRAMLWEGLEGADNQSVIAEINNQPADPFVQEGYSLIVVHAWSRYLSDVADVVDQLDSDVEVVTPEEFVRRITGQIRP